MRVLYFVDRFWPLIGGVEVISARLVPALAARGHELVVVTSRENDWMAEHDALDGVPIRRLPFVEALQTRDLDLWAEAKTGIAEVVRSFRPELVHAVFTSPAVTFAAQAAPGPLLVSFHGSWPQIRSDPEGVFRRVVRRATWLTGCSQSAVDDVLRLAPEAAGRTSVVLNGLDPAFDGSPPEPPAGPPVLLCSGRLTHEKGFDVAVEAMTIVARDRPDAVLRIAGDGPERPALEARVDAAGLHGQVELLGWVAPDRAHALLAEARVVLVPSRLEGFGLVALEAALMARPVVAASTGGLPEVVLDGITGQLVPPDRPEDLARRVLGLLADEPGARALGRAARNRALQQFSGRRHTEDWDRLYSRFRPDGDLANAH